MSAQVVASSTNADCGLGSVVFQIYVAVRRDKASPDEWDESRETVQHCLHHTSAGKLSVTLAIRFCCFE